MGMRESGVMRVGLDKGWEATEVRVGVGVGATPLYRSDEARGVPYPQHGALQPLHHEPKTKATTTSPSRAAGRQVSRVLFRWRAHSAMQLPPEEEGTGTLEVQAQHLKLTPRWARREDVIGRGGVGSMRGALVLVGRGARRLRLVVAGRPYSRLCCR